MQKVNNETSMCNLLKELTVDENKKFDTSEKYWESKLEETKKLHEEELEGLRKILLSERDNTNQVFYQKSQFDKISYENKQLKKRIDDYETIIRYQE